MVKRRIMFTYTPELIREPIIHTLGQQFNIITNIETADIAKESGWVVMELEGTPEDIEQGLAWATSRGLRCEEAGEETE